MNLTRKRPCNCHVCNELITTKEWADKVQSNKTECLNCVGMRLVRWALGRVRVMNRV